MNHHKAVLAEVIKIAKTKQKAVTGLRVLPVVQHGQTRYFADLRLAQFRDIENPHNYVAFDSEQGRLICRQTGVIRCPKYGMSVIISRASEQQNLRCMQCMSSIEPLPDE